MWSVINGGRPFQAAGTDCYCPGCLGLRNGQRIVDVITVLERATERILRGGWTQGAWFRDDRSCLVQALRFGATAGREYIAAGNWGHASGTMRSLADAAALALMVWLNTNADTHLVGDPVGLVAWNDQPGRTQAEVVAALRGATAQLRETVKEYEGSGFDTRP